MCTLHADSKYACTCIHHQQLHAQAHTVGVDRHTYTDTLYTLQEHTHIHMIIQKTNTHPKYMYMNTHTCTCIHKYILHIT